MILQGQVAIVTGASRGIGPAIAGALAGAGATVVLAARNAGELEQASGRITATGGKALTIPTDVSSESDVRQMVQTTVERLGKLDILVNNAGVGLFDKLIESQTEQWDWVTDASDDSGSVLAGRVIDVAKY